MTAVPYPLLRDRLRGWVVPAVLAVLCCAGAVRGQSPVRSIPSPPRPLPAPVLVLADPLPTPHDANEIVDGAVTPAGCAACAKGLLGLGPPPLASDFGGVGSVGCATCNGAGCVPGRQGCYPCNADTRFGRICCALYECICCPDPCYEPRWLPIADAAFFVDAPRPATQMRVRWASVLRLGAPDRAEFFWARADGKGRGPKPVAPFLGEKDVKYDDLRIYTEGATGAIGVFVETTYRALDPALAPHAGGFVDLVTGTKTLLYDCELLQLAFQFKTYIPTGNVVKGLGTGHVSLEPSVILGVKLAPNTYLQTQIAEWIPLGGDPDYQGSVLHYHVSLNQVLYRFLPDVPLIGTAEFNGWSFQDGAYTDPVNGPFQKAGGDTYLTLGGGLRLVVCDKVDAGAAAAFGLGNHRVPNQEYRLEMRVRY